MKKYINYLTTGLSLFVLALVMSSSVFAAAKTAKGKIQTSAHSNISGASVSVECNGTTLNDTTDSNGDFEVVFADGVCESGSVVTMNASFGGETGSDSTTAGNGPIISFNVLALSPEAVGVPEFGAITGLIAAGGSALAYFKLRRKIA